MGRMLKKTSSTTSSIEKPSFFKVMIGDFEEKLRVPTEFIRHFNGKLPQKSILTSPTGRSWTIQVKKVGNDLFFSKGWEAFVNDHSLEYGDFLIFRYKGESKFNVKIYGRNGCEKEVHSNHVKLLFEVKKEKDDDLIPDMEEEKEGEKVETRKPAMENEEKDVAAVTATSIKTTSPLFTVIWKPFMNCRLIIPRTFAVENGLKTKKSIVLQEPDGRLWPVETYQRVDTGVDLVKGWHQFCEGNRLTDGDTCQFEFLNQREDNKVNVCIFRKKTTKE